jgi:sugar O-acyltransferase (sialic acid O-acetyltransferase NeuD family)
MKSSNFSVNSAGVFVLVAVADPQARYSLIHGLPRDVIHHTLISKNAHIYESVIGAGGIVCPETVVTCNVEIGKYCHLNLSTTVGHDCRIGDYFTTAPGAHISGNCVIGDRVYFGTGASVRQKIRICDDVTIGMGSIVVKDIDVPGVYAGVPAKLMKN